MSKRLFLLYSFTFYIFVMNKNKIILIIVCLICSLNALYSQNNTLLKQKQKSDELLSEKTHPSRYWYKRSVLYTELIQKESSNIDYLKESVNAIIKTKNKRKNRFLKKKIDNQIVNLISLTKLLLENKFSNQQWERGLAILNITDSLSLLPNVNMNKNDTINYFSGIICYYTNNYKKCKKYFSYIKSDYKKEIIIYIQAQINIKQNKFNNAKQLLKSNDSKINLSQLCELYYQLNQFDSSLIIINKLVAKTSNITYKLKKALILEKLEKKDSALKIYQKILSDTLSEIAIFNSARIEYIKAERYYIQALKSKEVKIFEENYNKALNKYTIAKELFSKYIRHLSTKTTKKLAQNYLNEINKKLQIYYKNK